MEDRKVAQGLLDILACPACDSRPKVELTEDGLKCPNCGRVYPIEGGIPIMLVEKATVIGGKGE